jgi:ligand-binding sensor domain-containing protein
MRILYLILLINVLSVRTWAQPISFNFQRVGVLQGLSSNLATSVCQDKYGYIWIGNTIGVDRYNGYEVKKFEKIRGDSCAIYSGGTSNFLCDTEGRLWMGLINGLVEYDYEKSCFRKIGEGTVKWVNKIIEVQPKCLFIAMRGDGLAKIDTRNDSITFFDSKKYGLQKKIVTVNNMTLLGRDLYLASDSGIILFNLDLEQFREVQMPVGLIEKRIGRIEVEPNGRLWFALVGDPAIIYQTTTRFDVWNTYHVPEFESTSQANSITSFFIDRQLRLWVTSLYSGLARYDPINDKFRVIRSEPWMPNGIPSVSSRNLFQDRDGKIWGSSRKGAFFFDPENRIFESIIPGNAADANENLIIARGIVETPDRKLWFATGEGLFFMDPITGNTQHYVNKKDKPKMLHDNSVRAVNLDSKGDLWIATAKGVNRLRAGSKKIEFLDDKDGLPLVVSKSIIESRDGTIWVANFSPDGHCYKPPGATKFKPLSEHPVLGHLAGPYGQCLLEDSRGNIWFGLDGNGLIYYNPLQKVAKQWRQNQINNDSTLLGNFVYSLTEDNYGRIWAASSEGLSRIDPATFSFTNFDKSTGLPTNRFFSIQADKNHQIWVGTAQGLLLLNDSGELIRQFDKNDGLIEPEFSDRPAYQLQDGRFVFPTTRGFLTFFPQNYVAKVPDIPLLLSQVRVFNQPYATQTNIENLKELFLPPGKNFLSLEMLAFNYTNPGQIWYAYKMEPYDRDWIITKERTAMYTAVPAGSYLFKYKATANPQNWNVPEKSLSIEIADYWYKSRLLWGFVFVLLTALAIAEYSRRTRLKLAFFSLEQKAQALSKEKALVQYENLTQQLNPHFLFNSLASLGSLIRFDQKTASEFLEALSKMYRYILQSRDRETVTLQEEVAFAEHFIKLQKTRFEDAFVIRFNIEVQYYDRKIVPVTLQNLLENALKHNTFDISEPLVIDIFTEPNYLVMRNNLQRRSVVETSNKQGLSRLRSLYQYLCDAPMEIIETTDFFIVRIPLI